MKSHNPFFSIVIPCYKAEEYFITTTSSVLQQSFENIELILIDDCSPKLEGSKNILDLSIQLADEDERVLVLRNNTNLNISRTMNRGIEAARGKYIIFLDSDDYLEEGILDIVYNEIEKSINTIDIIQCSFNIETDGCVKPCGSQLPRLFLENENRYEQIIRERINRRLFCACASKFIRLDWLRESGIKFNCKYDSYQDFDFTMRVYFRANEIRTIDVASFVHVCRKDSVSTDLSEQSIVNRINMWTEWYVSVDDMPISREIRLKFKIYLAGQLLKLCRRMEVSQLPDEQKIKCYKMVDGYKNIVVKTSSKYQIISRILLIYRGTRAYLKYIDKK